MRTLHIPLLAALGASALAALLVAVSRWATASTDRALAGLSIPLPPVL